MKARFKRHGRVIARIRSRALYAVMRATGTRVVTMRPRICRLHEPVMFIGSAEEQARLSGWAAETPPDAAQEFADTCRMWADAFEAAASLPTPVPCTAR